MYSTAILLTRSNHSLSIDPALGRGRGERPDTQPQPFTVSTCEGQVSNHTQTLNSKFTREFGDGCIWDPMCAPLEAFDLLITHWHQLEWQWKLKFTGMSSQFNMLLPLKWYRNNVFKCQSLYLINSVICSCFSGNDIFFSCTAISWWYL